jgi:hypothetical protein
MKKWFLLLVLITAFGLCNAAWARVALGVKAGVNLANMTVSGTDAESNVKYSIRPGLMLGGTIEAPLIASNKLTVRGEVLYVMKGSKLSKDTPVLTFKRTDDVDELVFAPFLVYRFRSPGPTLFVNAGPEFGFNVNKKYKTTGSISNSGTIPDWSNMNLSLNAGAGVALPVGKGEFIFDARYNYGVTNLYTGNGDFKIKTWGIQGLLGYAFSIPGE